MLKRIQRGRQELQIGVACRPKMSQNVPIGTFRDIFRTFYQMLLSILLSSLVEVIMYITSDLLLDHIAQNVGVRQTLQKNAKGSKKNETNKYIIFFRENTIKNLQVVYVFITFGAIRASPLNKEKHPGLQSTHPMTCSVAF